MDATIQNLTVHRTLFCLAIFAEVIANLFYLLLALALYRLFQGVNKIQAMLLVLFVCIGTVMDFVNLQNRLAILTLIDSHPQADQVLFYINNFRNGIRVNELFWGLWLFPLGYLIYKSAYIPKMIGIILMIGCFGYVADSIGSFFFPAFNELNIANYLIIPASIGELATCLWLLIAGVRQKTG